MLVAALPAGYGFARSMDGTPDPVEAKPFNERMVVFWRLSGMRIEVSWRISPLEGRDLHEACAELNAELRPSSDHAVVDPPPPPTDVLEKWDAAQSAPIQGPPPGGTAPHTVVVVEHVEGGLYSGQQIGAAGPGAHAEDFTQVWAQVEGQIDLSALADALADVRGQLRERATEMEHDRGIGLLADAETAARRGNGPAVLERLRSAGTWVRDTATSIGAPVVTAALKAAFGL